MKHGLGILKLTTNEIYEGEWFEGKKSGRGIY
jgi:hypothetical protein